ncbi:MULTISPECIES: hypothetical protein [unclassified Mycobacterium]|uniref:hypothetical protein n=1 Tax=unclassified Mycobacterium TaxID=2642494 RepID=UPI00073FB131|nr:MULTISPECIES: hypothetical protein [unclassified Mycobacterium]KUH85623.1 hypothetical protein AU186_23070 [Mycobacterium sp. GA-1999]KUH91481.1 hypothetical protein AU185_10135 [Mycobacterium sp. GA-0227b]KUH96265.1 hypothetical protein AU187_13710 [Mycobacterium sp. IS-1556]
MQTGTDDPSDPAVERVRRELARLGRDAASAPDVPPEITARIGAALHAAGEPAHAVERPRLRLIHIIGLVAGLAAAVAGIVIGTSVLTRDPAPRFAQTGPTAERITVSRPPAVLPLTNEQLVGLLTTPPDYGPLSDPQRRAACLEGLGYAPTTAILGARPVDMGGHPGVVLLVAADSAADVTALVVEAGCHAAHGGLLAETVVARP